jgi:hypothetical protein
VRLQNAWFKDANRLAKHCAASSQVAAIEMTKGTGLYPRDLLLKCMSAGIIVPITADGRELQFRRPRIDPVSFQGFELRFAVLYNIPVGVETAPAWPLPIRDTAAFWDVANPDRITIPPGVTVMSFSAGMMQDGPAGGQTLAGIIAPTGFKYARNDGFMGGQHGSACHTGPVTVVPGDIWKARFYVSAGAGNLAPWTTFFSGVVEEAT